MLTQTIPKGDHTMATQNPVVSEYVDAYAKTQTIMLNTVEAWAEQAYNGFQSMLATTDGKTPTVAGFNTVDPVEAVDLMFAQITKGIELQQAFIRSIAEATAPLMSRAVADTRNAVDTFTAQATEAALDVAHTATAAAAATGSKSTPSTKTTSRAHKS